MRIQIVSTMYNNICLVETYPPKRGWPGCQRRPGCDCLGSCLFSEMVVSSTYFQRSVAGTSSPLIMMMNSHSPNFAPWGTHVEATPHSEKQSWPSLTRSLHEVRKSMTQEITGSGMSYKHSFSTFRGSMRSRAFLKSKKTTLIVASLPSVALFQAWIMLTRASEVPKPGTMPNCLGSTFASAAGLT